MLPAIISLAVLGLFLGTTLGIADKYLKVEGNPLADEIEAMLPGSQCGQCGFPGCSPAAAALAEGEATVTLCPPGGKDLAEALASKLGVEVDLSAVADQDPQVATINESLCIGCTKCFKRCPTDAILGGPKQIHAVMSEACTGCEKCVDICPTECVSMKPVKVTLKDWHWPKPSMAA